MGYSLLEDISFELLLNIIDYLEERDIFRIRHTSRYLYHSLDNKYVKKRLFPQCENISYYSIQEIYVILRFTYAKYSKTMNIKYITISGGEINFTIPKLNTRFLSLENVDISAYYFGELLNSLYSLQSLTLSNINMDVVWKNIDNVIRVKNLFLENCEDKKHRNITSFNKKNSLLRLVSLQKCDLKWFPYWFYTDSIREIYIFDSSIDNFPSGISDTKMNILRIEKSKINNFPLDEIRKMKINYKLFVYTEK